jgi:N-acetylmuramic acid 6-phosphate etherase
MDKKNNTESSSYYNDLETKSVKELISNINQEDFSVAETVKESLPQIEKLITAALLKMKAGGRLFYIGAGTSGRLGILDASEIPPTYGVSHDMVIGLIAGGDIAIRKAVEFAEDDTEQAWKDLLAYAISDKDFLIGIAASGATPYVLGGIKAARENGIGTGCIVCNAGSNIAAAADCPVELLTGSEFVTGSTRMKAGTAQKMVLNMISTALMIQLGKVKGNKMIEMQLSNVKLWRRAASIISQELGISKEAAQELVKKHKSIKKAIKAFQTQQVSKI